MTLLLFVLGVNAASLDDLTYTTADGKVTITDCDEAATGELVIPQTIRENPVTSIRNFAFYKCSRLTSITIPDWAKPTKFHLQINSLAANLLKLWKM